MLIDVHAHFHHDHSPRADWAAVNARRFAACERIGVRWQVGSVLGTWGRTSPTYFPSPDDVRYGNDRMLEIAEAHPDRVRAYVVVNPNFPAQARDEIERCTARGAVGVKLAASRRATDALLDPIIEQAGANDLPVLHHVWQHRRRDWPGQEASDGAELCALARRHPRTRFILAHIAGGGDWQHSLRAAAGVVNVYLDLAGSGADAGMVEGALAAVGAARLVWGADLTLCTALARLRVLERLALPGDELEAIKGGNAQRIFVRGRFDASSRSATRRGGTSRRSDAG